MEDGSVVYRDVYEGTGYWGQNDEEFTTNDYNSTPEYKQNIEQGTDDHDNTYGLKEENFISLDTDEDFDDESTEIVAEYY